VQNFRLSISNTAHEHRKYRNVLKKAEAQATEQRQTDKREAKRKNKKCQMLYV
jgi:hypothetical protein